MARTKQPVAESTPPPQSEHAVRETDHALEQTRTSLRSILDAAREIVFVHHEGTVVYVNDAAVAALGYDHREELIGRPFAAIVDTTDRSTTQHLRAFADGRASVAAPRRVSLICRDASIRATETAAMPIVFDGVLATAVLATDVTETERTLARLVQADRLAALGTLCAGAAHEINNPLTYTLLNIEHTLRALRVRSASGDVTLTRAQVDEVIASLSRSMEGAMRVSEIGRSLTLFARGGGGERRCIVHVGNALDSSIKMSMHEIRQRARLVQDFREVPLVDANDTSLGQVFINLLVNAAQSIPEGDVEKNEVRVTTMTDERGNAVVEIADTGIGIEADFLSRVFDPFYTSKDVGGGTGLGLSISHGTIRALGGEIFVASTPGVGSAFRVVLPPSSSAPRAEQPRERQVGFAPTVARVLVVDDEELVGEAIVRALEDECSVTHARSGHDALSLLSDGSTYDVILCDVMMKGLSVADLHAAATQVAPHLTGRFVFMTGGAFTPKARAFLESCGSPCIEKPIGLSKLREIVRGYAATTPR